MQIGLAILVCGSMVVLQGTAATNEYEIAGGYTLRYEGGYRFKQKGYGSSRLAYGPGPMCVSDDGKNIWVAGHAHHHSIARFSLDEPVLSQKISDFPRAPNADPFVKVSPPVKSKNPPGRIVGMQQIGDQLLVNTLIYYDASGKGSETSVLFTDAFSLSSPQIGYFSFEGRAHAAGWASPIPERLQATLQGDYLVGFAGNLPINSRLSMGPTLFAWNTSELLTKAKAASPVSTKQLIDYSIRNPLHKDLYNKNRDNDLWTEVSCAYHGFIPPGKNHYMVIGSSGGHEGGIGYKIVQDNGNRAGGPAPYLHKDWQNYFWIYDLQDVLPVLEGKATPHDPRPVHYGELPVFAAGGIIQGADFVPATGRLYILIGSADTTQSRYERQPVLLVYSLYGTVTTPDGDEQTVLLNTEAERFAATLSTQSK
jgi:hypothetical protein